MYPLNIFNLFPPFPRENKVFVAMDFDEKFERRWKEVIVPAVKDVPIDSSINGSKLEPYRVDMKWVSDSIITEIILGIGNCSLFFADLTTIGKIKTKAIRNSNVMYEVGIAHAVRLPEEVILFRSDKDPLLFDTANIRVNYYDPDKKPEEAINVIKEALNSALKEIDLQKHFSVQRAADSLTVDSRKCLQKFEIDNKSEIVSLVERKNSFRQLLELGIISASYSDLAPFLLAKDGKVKSEYRGKRNPLFGSGIQTKDGKTYFDYKITPFGFAVFDEVIARSRRI